MESPVVVCEECGTETKTVPKSKKCRHCGYKVFVYVNAKGEDKELDFRTHSETWDDDGRYEESWHGYRY